MKTRNIILLLLAYGFLLLTDVAFNGLAIFIPSLGGVAESISEIVIESLSAVIVAIIAFSKKGE